MAVKDLSKYRPKVKIEGKIKVTVIGNGKVSVKDPNVVIEHKT